MSRRTLVIFGAILVMVLAILAMLAAPSSAEAQTPAPARLAVTAVWAGDGARVSWPRVAGAAVVSIGRPGGRQPLGRPVSPTATVWRQGRGSLDVNMALRPGDAVEVRVWDARGELLAVGGGHSSGGRYICRRYGGRFACKHEAAPLAFHQGGCEIHEPTGS